MSDERRAAYLASLELADDETIATALETLEWAREGDLLTKTVRLADFARALEYVNRVGALAEAAGHHPDLEIHWNTVTLRLWTHVRSGITLADLALARAIDTLG